MQQRNNDILSRFYNDRYEYTKEDLKQDFMDEIKRYSNNYYDFHQRAARLGAAVKRYKTSEAIKFIINIAMDENLDITPTLAKKLMFELFERKGSQKEIVSLFGQAGRTTKSTTNDKKTIERIVITYKQNADKVKKSIYYLLN